MGRRKLGRIALNEEQRRLAAENMGIVPYAIEKKFGHSLAMEDDFISEGYVALCIAAYTFDENMGCKFSTYAYTVIVKRILQTMRQDRMKKRRPSEPDVSIETPIQITDGEKRMGDFLEAGGHDVERGYIEEETQKELVRLARKVETMEPDLVRVHRGMNQYRLAEERGVSPQAISKMVKDSRKQIVDKYKGEYRRIMGYDADDCRRA